MIFKIRNSKNSNERLPHYKSLLRIARKAQGQLIDLLRKVERLCFETFSEKLADGFESLRTLHGFLDRIIDQTDRRVVQGKKVPVEKKIVSIFEPHTDILVKDRRETHFGHKLFISSGESNLVLDCQIPRGNPSDKDIFAKCLDEVIEKVGRAPLQTSADGGFASRQNVKDGKEREVKDVCFGKPCGMEITDMVKSTWVFKRLRNWRAGIEAIISFLKRGFGLSVCNWHGFDGFCRYVKSSVVAYNLTLMARYELKQD